MDYFWFSFSKLNEKTLDILNSSRIKFNNDLSNENLENFLLIYDSPDRMINSLINNNSEIFDLSKIYNSILSLKKEKNCLLTSAWRIENLNINQVNKIFSDDFIKIKEKEFTLHNQFSNSFVLALCLLLIDLDKSILNRYIELEMNSKLFDTEPDIDIYTRYQDSLNSANRLLKDFIKPISELKFNTEKLKKEISNLKGELADVKNSNKLLKEKNNDLLNKNKKQLGEMKNYINSSNLNISKLHETQDELEKYYLLCQSYKDISTENNIQLSRAKELFAKFLSPNIYKTKSFNMISDKEENLSYVYNLENLLNSYSNSLNRSLKIILKIISGKNK